MEINYIENKKNLIIFEIKGVDHGFCNLLKEELSKDKNIKFVAYRIDHPQIGIPKFKIEGDDIKKSLKNAIKNIREKMNDFKKQISKI